MYYVKYFSKKFEKNLNLAGFAPLFLFERKMNEK